MKTLEISKLSVGSWLMLLAKYAWLLVNLVLCAVTLVLPELGRIVLILAIVTNLMIMIKFHRVQPAMIMSAFFLSYIAFLIPYYFYGFIISERDKYYRLEIYNQALIIHNIFLNSFSFFLSAKINQKKLVIRDLIPHFDNRIIFSFLITLLVVMLITVKGESVIGEGSSYQAYVDNLNQQGGTLEYFYIVFIAAFFFNKSKIGNAILFAIATWYLYSCLVRGFRIQMVQMLLLIYVLYFDGRIKNALLIPLSFMGYLASEVSNFIKTYGQFSLADLDKILEFSSSSKIIINNQTDVLYSSASFLGMIKDGYYDLYTRCLSAMGFVLNWFVPSSFVWKEARVPEYTKTFTSLGGGGLVSAYWFVWFGYMGVIFLGWMLGSLFNESYRHPSQRTFKVVIVVLVVVYPRWFAYDPGNFLMRFPIYMIVFFTAMIAINYKLKKIVW